MKNGILALCALATFCMPALVAKAAVASHATYTAELAKHSPAADFSLSDPDWKSGKITGGDGSFEDVTTRSAAPLATDAYVLYDAQNLYVAFKSQQSTVPITANQTTNNVGFGLDDFVGIGIDPSGNGSTVYYFETTPRGTRYQQSSESSRYMPVWSTAVKVDKGAWIAVMTIPLNALHRSSASKQTWRFNFIRGVAAAAEHYTWAFDGTMVDATGSQWPSFGDAQFWPRISGIGVTGEGHRFQDKVQADVYALGSAGGDRKLFAQANGTFQPEPARVAGLDFKYALADTVHLVATVNPDFSNVEVDQQTIVPQEFKQVLVEYRPFFAQGASFLNPVSPSAGANQPNNQIFYSPSIGPFDRGMKVEGSLGYQSFGVLSFRGYDQTTNNEFDDVAYGYAHTVPDQSFSYWSDGVIAHHSIAGNDTAAEVGADFHNARTGLQIGADESFEGGSYVPYPGHARSLSTWGLLIKPDYQAFIDYQDVTPNYNPIDGFTSISDTRGFVYSLSTSGSTRALKTYKVAISGDRYIDDSGAVHQSDVIATVNAKFKDQFSISIGPHDGQLRDYATQAPGAAGCDDPSLTRTSYTGFPNYYCGQTQAFNQFVVNLGYHDGTQAPIDFKYAVGPFGGTFLQQYSISDSRPLGTRLSIAGQYALTNGRTISNWSLNAQRLQLLSLGYNLGSDSNIALELRSVSGALNGLTTVPGTNVALSYHNKFVNGNELYLTFGTPAATQTLNRFILKYVVHAGLQD